MVSGPQQPEVGIGSQSASTVQAFAAGLICPGWLKQNDGGPPADSAPPLDEDLPPEAVLPALDDEAPPDGEEPADAELPALDAEVPPFDVEPANDEVAPPEPAAEVEPPQWLAPNAKLSATSVSHFVIRRAGLCDLICRE